MPPWSAIMHATTYKTMNSLHSYFSLPHRWAFFRFTTLKWKVTSGWLQLHPPALWADAGLPWKYQTIGMYWPRYATRGYFYCFPLYSLCWVVDKETGNSKY